MRRSLLSIAIVAAISGWISRGEHAVGRSAGDDWVRTAQGWQSRRVLQAPAPPAAPPVHPAVVASLQAGASLFFLIAFPSRVRATQPAGRAEGAPRRRSPQNVKPVAATA